MSSSEVSPTFVALALGLSMVAGGFVFFEPGSAAGRVSPEARTSLWLTEIERAVATQPCLSHGAKAEELAERAIEGIPIWAEKERVDVSQVLRSWRAVEMALRCAPGNVRPELRAQLEVERVRLKVRLSDNLRSWHATYVRASETQRDDEAIRALQGLLFLISAHPGNLRSDIERALRRLQEKRTE